jgi:hypothetical protein
MLKQKQIIIALLFFQPPKVAPAQLPLPSRERTATVHNLYRRPEPVSAHQLTGPGKPLDNFKTKFRLKHEQASESQQTAFSEDRGQYSALERGSSSRLSGRRLLSAQLALNIRIFAPGINDTSGKFATGVNDTSGK